MPVASAEPQVHGLAYFQPQTCQARQPTARSSHERFKEYADKGSARLDHKKGVRFRNAARTKEREHNGNSDNSSIDRLDKSG